MGLFSIFWFGGHRVGLSPVPIVIEHHNAHPKPFRWTKSADDILSSIERFCAYNSPPKA
jgi:hypothetical protein